MCLLWRKSFANAQQNLYEYLGPNCCRIDELLYRCYDNRLRLTERSPYLYGVSLLQNTDHRNEATNGSCLGVFHVSDNVTDHNEGILQFGRLPENWEWKWTGNWLWTCRGQLKVIATDFRVGVHYATKPHHFIPIIDHLEQLHANHYVHGDIRAYNMVLKYRDGTEDDQSRATENDAALENSLGSPPKPANTVVVQNEAA